MGRNCNPQITILLSLGVLPLAPGEHVQASLSWRPQETTTTAVLCVCSCTGALGEAADHCPMWDSLTPL